MLNDKVMQPEHAIVERHDTAETIAQRLHSGDECYYRIADSPYSEHGIEARVYQVVRRTPCGVWLDDYGTERFVRNHAKKRWAYPSVREALDSYHARKARHTYILNHQLYGAKIRLSAIRAVLGREVPDDE